MTGLPIHRTLVLTLIRLTTEPVTVKHDQSHFWPNKKQTKTEKPFIWPIKSNDRRYL